MQESVKQDRQNWIGGSDIPVILGISPFKTRWQLLREKAGLEEDTFTGNKYTEYGNIMEPKIRNFVNTDKYKYHFVEGEPFVEGKHVEEGYPIGFREHTDGENEDTVLEIKTTGGEIPWKVYRVQLIWYMMRTGKNFGTLAVYERPDDMSEEFDPDRLEIENIFLTAPDTKKLSKEITQAVNQFIEDLVRLKENPFLSEQDLMPDELIEVANQVILFEQRLAQLKEEEKAIKAEKKKLYEAMLNANTKKWETLNGYQITRVDAIPESEKEITEFNEDKFAAAEPELYAQYTEKKIITVSGRAGYVKITPPKEGK